MHDIYTSIASETTSRCIMCDCRLHQPKWDHSWDHRSAGADYASRSNQTTSRCIVCDYCISKVLTVVLEQIMGGCCIKIEPAANVIAADIDLNYVANISIQQRVLIESQNGYFSVESSICHVVVDE